MIRPLAVALALCAAAPASGQAVSTGTVALLRGLDKLSGTTEDLEIPVGGTASYARLDIAVSGCRFPTDNPNADAFVFMEIRDRRNDERLFYGWMIASAPALNALDDARYDVWVLGCR